MGRPKTIMGIAQLKETQSENLNLIPIMLTIKPINILPVSPIKIFAGLKLYLKNPRQDPARAMDKEAIKNCLSKLERRKKKKEAIAAIPTDKPSILSNRLKAFVIPTTHRNVNGISILGLCVKERLVPKIITSHVANIWKESFKNGGKPLTSSINPAIRIIMEPKNTANISGVGFEIERKENAKRKTMAIAKPPRSGMGSICIFLAPGISNILNFKAIVLIIGVPIKEPIRDARNIAM